MTYRKGLVVAVLNLTLCALLASQQNKKPVTNSDVVKMVHAGLPESTIILALQTSETDLDTSPQALIDLKDQGVSQKVMDAMLAAASKRKPNAPAERVSAPTTNTANGAAASSGGDGRTVMAKLVESLGGKAALQQVHGTRVVSTRHAKTPQGTVMMDTDITTVWPDRFYMVTKMGQFSSITKYSPGQASVNLNGRVQEIPAAAREELDKAMKLSILYVAQHADDPAYTFTVKGNEKIGESDTTVVEIATGKYQTRWNVDSGTGALKKVSRIANGVPTTFEYADWRAVSGVKVPFKITQSGALNSTEEVQTFEINPDFDESKFDNAVAANPSTSAMPSPAPPKMPAQSYAGKTFNAGGAWTFEVSEDKLTGAAYGIFELKADEQISDGISSDYPRFIIMCGGSMQSPKWINSKMISPVVLGVGDTHSAFGGSPQQFVTLRADDKFHTHAWNIADDYRVFFVDKGATKEFMNSSNARIQFRDASGHSQVAIFSPAGLDRTKAAIACGEIMK